MQVLYDALETFVTIRLRKVNEDDLNKRNDYGVPFCEHQYTTGLVVSLCLNANPFISLIPPNSLKF